MCNLVVASKSPILRLVGPYSHRSRNGGIARSAVGSQASPASTKKAQGLREEATTLTHTTTTVSDATSSCSVSRPRTASCR